LADPVLRERLEWVIAVLAEQLARPDQSLRKLMGKPIDATKTISSLTLFEAAGAGSTSEILDFVNERCRNTLQELKEMNNIVYTKGGFCTSKDYSDWSEINTNEKP